VAGVAVRDHVTAVAAAVMAPAAVALAERQARGECQTEHADDSTDQEPLHRILLW
jgi:hypothetical protein